MPAKVMPQPEVFNPKCEWANEPGCDNLHVHLPGFKRESLKVQVTTSRNLRVLGERTSNDKKPKLISFHKEFSLPEDCNVDGITAKFENEVLRIRLPKTTSPTLAIPKQETKADEKLHQKLPESEQGEQKSKKEDVPKEAETGRKKKNEENNKALANAAKPSPVGKPKPSKKKAILAIFIIAAAIGLGIGIWHSNPAQIPAIKKQYSLIPCNQSLISCEL